MDHIISIIAGAFLVGVTLGVPLGAVITNLARQGRRR